MGYDDFHQTVKSRCCDVMLLHDAATQCFFVIYCCVICCDVMLPHAMALCNAVDGEAYCTAYSTAPPPSKKVNLVVMKILARQMQKRDIYMAVCTIRCTKPRDGARISIILWYNIIML